MRSCICTVHPVRPTTTSAVSDPVAEGLFGHWDDEENGNAAQVDVDEDQALEAVAQEEKEELAAKDVSKAVEKNAGKGDGDIPPVPSQRYHKPRPLTEVKQPSPAEVARHNLTHLPYKKVVQVVCNGEMR